MANGGSGGFATSDVSYALAGDAHVAFRVLTGSRGSPPDLVLIRSGTASMESLFEDPIGVRFLTGLTALGRLVVFDRRGVGLSDPPADWNKAQSARGREDVEAVVATAHVNKPVLVCDRLSWPAVLMYCDRHPNDVTSLVMFEPAPLRFDLNIVRAQLAGEVDSVSLWCPSRADEPGFREWFIRAGQRGASPRVAEQLY